MYPIPGVNVVLYARFQHCRSNGVATYKEHSHLYYIDLFRLRVHLPHYTHETNVIIMRITQNTVFKFYNQDVWDFGFKYVASTGNRIRGLSHFHRLALSRTPGTFCISHANAYFPRLHLGDHLGAVASNLYELPPDNPDYEHPTELQSHRAWLTRMCHGAPPCSGDNHTEKLLSCIFTQNLSSQKWRNLFQRRFWATSVFH